MDFRRKTVHLRIRRYDLCENPNIQEKTIELSPYTDCSNLKGELQKLFGINDEKVIKIRNNDEVLVPVSFLLESKDWYVSISHFFFIDVTNISYIDKNCASLLQDAYVDAVKQKIRTLESRIAQSELLLPQLEWRRQAYMEDTVCALTNKVAFLNRRFDELLPQFTAKFPETIA
ncbi:hypothetical protein NQ315_010529 [Exocentrus adspersus]|uniref:Uncharacterized protein n=1 Tax=Exocentrus adspersus TaxID=1586481 RepID=A0AAV8W6G8_9CUCU|nr:hypothetical protein NQ315_010529 [Exocentrus adspersus]